MTFKGIRSHLQLFLLMLIASGMGACSTLKSVFTPEGETADTRPISNPFGTQNQGSLSGTGSSSNGIVLREKNQNGNTLEVELPTSDQQITDFVVPVQNRDRLPSGSTSQEAQNTADLDDRYRDTKSGATDREIASTLPQGNPENEWKRREIETGLGVILSEEQTTEENQSYLAQVDRIKQLYKSKRFEAGLVELDKMVRLYPTASRLYEMRGTLLDRLGYAELAQKSWEEALRLNPKNNTLRSFMERKKAKGGAQ